jgi:hypothetical protein
MKTKSMSLVVGILLLVAGVTYAQPCVPSYPPVIPVGTSHCFHVCPGTYITIQLEGNLPGPGATPVLILEPGCQTGYCNEPPCPAIDPPLSLIFGGDPYFPEDWYGESDCIIIYMRWVHDNIWEFEVFSFCEGCFCVTFDYQLSVNLASFTALPGNNEVTLNWTTASETNSDHFEILRDGTTMGTVAATNNATGSSYTFTDETAVNGQLYTYTLVSVDLAGTREELGSVNASPVDPSVVVTSYALHQNYPNPFNPETSISFDLVQGGLAKLAIYNVMGQTVATLVNGNVSAGRHTVVFNGSNLTSGVYLYKLETSGFSDTKKLVLLK